MIGVECTNLGKSFGFQSVLKNINLQLQPSSVTGISGRNGSGKSTLMKIISSYLTPSSGTIAFTSAGKPLERKSLPLLTSYSAPYIKLTQEFSLIELYNFHQKFKKLNAASSYKEFLDYCELENPKSKHIRNFSSGMQQKINIALSLLDSTPFLLLDEPTSYLDTETKKWFHQSLKGGLQNRTVVIASNDAEDFSICNVIYKIENQTLS